MQISEKYYNQNTEHVKLKANMKGGGGTFYSKLFEII